MDTNIPNAFSSVLFEYEQKVEPIAEHIRRLGAIAPTLINDVDGYTILFIGLFSSDEEYENFKDIVEDETISKNYLEITLTQDLYKIQNEYQMLAFYKTVERIRKSWFGYLKDLKEAIIISYRFKKELEDLIDNPRRFTALGSIDLLWY